jgi:hypothetical protein
MQQNLRSLAKEESLPHLKKNVVNTTLYELIEAIHEEVQPEEKRLVSEIVINLLNNYGSICWVQ